MTASGLAQRLNARRSADGWIARCPAHEDRTPSFSIREGNDGRVLLKCFAGCGLEDITRALNIEVTDLFNDNMTADQFKALAKSTLNAQEKVTQFLAAGALANNDSTPSELSPLSDIQLAALAKWRGYSQELVEWLNKYGLIGHFEGNIGFPVTNGVHFRKKDDGSWRYTQGAKPDLFVLGGVEEGAHVHVFESQWDALAFADSQGERTNIVATRGASNIRLLDKFLNFSGTLYLWPQNDAPGQKWAADIAHDLNCQVKLVDIPADVKDLNEWRLKGATDGDVLNAYIDAKDFGAVTSKKQLAKTDSALPASDPENNFPAPVLAEPPTLEKTSGEARESTSYPGYISDSRGGENDLSGEKEERETNLTALSPSQSDAGMAAPAQDTPLARTLDDVVAFLRRYVVFPLEEQAEVIALWVAHSWTFSSFRFTPYLNVCSPEKRCGKTRLLRCLHLLAAKPRKSDGISAAALRRIIDSERPTLLLDEIDTIFGTDTNEGNEALRGALNAGFETGGKYICCDGPRNEIREFNVFCPKAIAGIGKNLPDTVRDRSIEIRLIRQVAGEKAENLRAGDGERQVAQIRAALDSWSRASGKSLATARPSMPSQLGDRQQDMMEPLAAIADEAGGEWPQRARDALVSVGAASEDTSVGVQLLADCRMIFGAIGQDRISSTMLLTQLVEIESDTSPWPTWWEGDIKNGKTHGPARKLATLLAPFGIKPTTIKLQDDDAAKGYYRISFLDAWKRYLNPVKGMVTMELEL